MAWYDYDLGSPPVFSPKVTPDPVDAERLEEKRLQATIRLKFKPHYSQPLTSVPSLIASSTSPDRKK